MHVTAPGATVVICAVLIGLIVGVQNALDGLQTALVIALAWMVLSSVYHAALAFLPRRKGRR